MRTDELIALLARQPGADWRPPRGRWAVALMAGMALAFLAMALSLGPRDPQLWPYLTAGFALKLALCLSLWLVAVQLAWRRSLPARGDGPWRSAVPGLALLLLVLAAAAWLPADAAARHAQWWSPTILTCLLSIPLLGLPAGLLLGWAARQGAATDPAASGWAVGLSAGACGALAYAFHCPMDAPAYLLCWYLPAIALTGVLGRWAGRRWLRW
jgi:hypothetical protein